jgi:putative phosphoesterase
MGSDGEITTLILSDIHANIEALWAVEEDLKRRGEDCGRVLVLGDLVDYGAAPLACVDWIRRKSRHVVRGNHDHALATATQCHSASPFGEIGLAMRELFRPRFDAESLAFLRQLPRQLSLTIDGQKLELVHATPREPLFEYASPSASDEQWLGFLGPAAETESLVLLGHTHFPFMRKVGRVHIVNPGSLGQPRDGDPRGCYAVLRQKQVELRRVEYDVEGAVARLHKLSLPFWYADFLCEVLRTGSVPA